MTRYMTKHGHEPQISVVLSEEVVLRRQEQVSAVKLAEFIPEALFEGFACVWAVLFQRNLL